MADYLILISDPDLTIVGDPIVCSTNIDVTLRFNEPGSGLFESPAHDWLVEQIAPGNRVIVIRDGAVLLAGPIEKWLMERADDGDNAGVGKITVTFADDLALVAARTVYPDPAQDVDSQTADNWTYTGNAELGLHDLVDLNAGPGALTPRQVSHLIIGAPTGVGASITVKATRMQPIGELMRAMAETGGQLGFRVTQVGTDLVFSVYEPDDKSAEVRFSFALGNTKYLGYEVSAPTATSIAVGGQGATGVDAYMLERLNSAEEALWGRFEKLVARPGNDPTGELEDDGDRALAAGASTTRLASSLSDTPDQRFGVHYQVGDIVSVESWPGSEVVDIVRVVHLQVTPGSNEYVSATVGSQSAVTEPEWMQRLRAIDERLGRIERTVQPA